MANQNLQTFQKFTYNENQHDHDHGLDLKENLTNNHDIMMFSFEVFDEISSKIVNDPVFVNAQVNWGVYDRVLYKQCARLGVDRVRATVKEVQVKAGLGNRGAYLLKVLRSM